MYNYNKYVCLVSGASSGIGKDIAIELSNHSKHIYIVARNVDRLEKVHDIIVNNNCNCTIVPLDICKVGSVENLAKEVFNKDGLLDVMILSAGIIRQLAPIESIKADDFYDIYNLNYFANFRFIKYFHSLLKCSTDANLCVISQKKDEMKSQYWGGYLPTMLALNELVMTYAEETARTNIKANIFCPKPVDTKFREVVMPGEDKTNLLSSKYVAANIVKKIIKNRDSGKIIDIY